MPVTLPRRPVFELPTGLVRLRLDWCGRCDDWSFLSALSNLTNVWINHSGLKPDEDPGADLTGARSIRPRPGPSPPPRSPSQPTRLRGDP